MEAWVDNSKYPNYQVSTHGRIKNRRTGHILKPSRDRYGYQKVSLGSVDNIQVHRLICETFYGSSPDDNYQVNHIDRNRSNNHVLNLEWNTPSENIRWGVRCGSIDPSIGLKKACEVNRKPVRVVELNEVFSSVKECAEYLGVRPQNVNRCLIGERKGQRLHGYHIEYV